MIVPFKHIMTTNYYYTAQNKGNGFSSNFCVAMTTSWRDLILLNHTSKFCGTLLVKCHLGL